MRHHFVHILFFQLLITVTSLWAQMLHYFIRWFRIFVAANPGIWQKCCINSFVDSQFFVAVHTGMRPCFLLHWWMIFLSSCGFAYVPFVFSLSALLFCHLCHWLRFSYRVTSSRDLVMMSFRFVVELGGRYSSRIMKIPLISTLRCHFFPSVSCRKLMSFNRMLLYGHPPLIVPFRGLFLCCQVLMIPEIGSGYPFWPLFPVALSLNRFQRCHLFNVLKWPFRTRRCRFGAVEGSWHDVTTLWHSRKKQVDFASIFWFGYTAPIL